MRMRNSMLAALAAGLLATPAAAQNLALDELGALVVLPIIGGTTDVDDIYAIDANGQGITLNTITNASAYSRVLKIDLINGDDLMAAEEYVTPWDSTSFECELTGRETTTFVFVDGAVYVECSDGSDTEGDDKAFFTNFTNGLMVVALADPQSGQVISENSLLADSVVVDVAQGQAFSFGAISFQAGFGQNDGNKIYAFDGQEYAQFPSVLATNFITPSVYGLNAELILFTLDGSVGTTAAPRAKLGGFAYNDDEEAVDFQHEFSCFDIAPLNEMNPNIWFGGGVGLGTLSGHLELAIQPTATQNDAHDDQYGDGNDTRRRPVHGWIVQNVLGENPMGMLGCPVADPACVAPGPIGGVVVPPGAPVPQQRTLVSVPVGGTAAWGRPLQQGRLAVIPFGGDQPATLDADVLN